MTKHPSFRILAAVLLTLACFAAPAAAQDAIAKAVTSISQTILVKDYEKAYTYAQFIIRFYRATPMPVDALDACERAIAAYGQDLSARQQWEKIVQVADALKGAPPTVAAKMAEPLARAQTELKRLEEERLRQEEEARKAEAEQARLALIEQALTAEREAERQREALRQQERDLAAKREAELLQERAKAEAQQREQIDQIIAENRRQEALKEQQRETQRLEYEQRQAELEQRRIAAEESYRSELSRMMDTASATNAQTIRAVSETSFAMIIGLGVLALFVIVGVIVLVIVALRNQRMQHEQFQSTMQTMQAMRYAQPVPAGPALPYMPQDSLDMRALPGGGQLMIEDANGRPAADVPGAPLAEAARLKHLINQCLQYGQEIDRTTGRRNASRIVADLVYKVSRHLGYGEQDALVFFCVGLVYDIGFLNLDPAILRADQLSEAQFDLIKTHTTAGTSMVFFVEETYRSVFRNGVAMHHENIDGTGYPAGLKGEQIPYIARVIRVVESYVALISSREYRQIRDRDTAMAELLRHEAQYDQDIVRALDSIV